MKTDAEIRERIATLRYNRQGLDRGALTERIDAQVKSLEWVLS